MGVRRFLAVAAVASTMVVTACSSATNNAASGTAATGRVHIEVVTHGSATTPFWSVFKNGVDQAAKDMNVDVHYQAPDTFDMVRMSQLIDAAVATKPDGLVVSIPDAKALGPAIKRAVAAGIPVISANSGSDVYKSLGVLVHIGQPEYDAGYQGGLRMADAGARKAICLNGEVGNAALDLRCQGFADALAKVGGTSKVLGVSLADPTGTQQATQAAILSDHPDALFSVATVAIPALKAIQASGNTGKIKLATFDLGPAELQAVADGEMLFCIDQQEYLQGYLPIVFLANYKRYGVLPGGGGVIATGPGFVTKDNAAQVISLSKQGIR